MELRKDIIKRWMERAKKDISIKDGLGRGFQYSDILISCWISFEAFSCIFSDEDGVKKRIDVFCKKFQKYYETEYGNFPTDFKLALNELSTLTVSDMRPRHFSDSPKKIKDKTKLTDILEVIYQVRNNLFHGGKDVKKEDDERKIRLSAIILYRLMEKILLKEDILK